MADPSKDFTTAKVKDMLANGCIKIANYAILCAYSKPMDLKANSTFE